MLSLFTVRAGSAKLAANQNATALVGRRNERRQVTSADPITPCEQHQFPAIYQRLEQAISPRACV